MAEILRIPLRVVFYKEGDRYIARCLEFDLIGDGLTRDEALESLSEAISIQIECSAEHRNPKNLFTPADGQYYRMFFAGKDVAMGELSFKVDNLVIEGTEYREYEYDDDYAVA